METNYNLMNGCEDPQLINSKLRSQLEALERLHGGYPYQHMGIARLLLSSFKSDVIHYAPGDEFRDYVRCQLDIQRRDAFKSCAITGLDDVLQLYGCRLTNSQDLDYLFSENYGTGMPNESIFIRTEGEYLHRVIKDNHKVKGGIRDPVTKKNIDNELRNRTISQGVNNPLRMLYLTRDQFPEFIEGDINSLPFDVITIRLKSRHSITANLLERNRRIYLPTDEEIELIHHRREIPQRLYGRRYKFDHLAFAENHEEWIRKLLQDGKDIDDSFQYYLPSQFLNELIRRENGNKELPTENIFGGDVNNVFKGPFADDIVGLGLYTQTGVQLKKLVGQIENGDLQRFRILPGKIENTLRSQRKKDGSVVIGLTAPDTRLEVEVRAKSLIQLLKSEAGGTDTDAHIKYRKSENEKNEKAIKSNDKRNNRSQRKEHYIKQGNKIFNQLDTTPEEIGLDPKPFER